MLYKPRTDEMLYVLTQVVHAERQLQELPAHAEVDAALMAQLMDEAGKFVASEIAPLNRMGDETGARWKNGTVTMPRGFRDAYQAFWQAGWPALAAAPEDGGQGLPAVLEAMLFEMLSEPDARDPNAPAPRLGIRPRGSGRPGGPKPGPGPRGLPRGVSRSAKGQRRRK